MQESQVQCLVLEDPTSHRATRLLCHNYWVCALEPVQFSQSIVSDALWPHGLQHARLHCLLSAVKCWPIPPQERLKHSSGLVSVGSLGSRARELQYLKPIGPRASALQWECTLLTATREKPMQQQRPSTVINFKKKNFFFLKNKQVRFWRLVLTLIFF